MSSLAPTKRDFPANSLPSRTGLVGWLRPYLTSTVGTKMLVAVTGTLLTGFLVAHLAGNLKIFAGRDAINSYAQFLKDLGPLLWVARIGLLATVVVHLGLALALRKRSAEARPVAYAFQNTVQASIPSRTMAQTGLIILAFILFHLAHYTLGMIGTVQVNGQTVSYLSLKDELGRHDVYSMVIHGFRNPVVSVLYILAQLVLLMHLSHGIASVFQTLGLNTPRTGGAIRALGLLIAFAIVLGNIGIVLGVWFGPLTPAVGI